MTERISSRQNPLIKRLAALASGAVSPREGEYICDGPKLLEDALRSGVTPMCVLAAEGTELPELPELTRLAVAPYELVRTVSPSRTPQGVVFTCATPKPEAAVDPNGMYLLLDRMQDPRNVGAMLRTAEAFGASGAWLTEGSADPFGPKAVRAGMGAVFRLPVRFVSVSDVVASGLPVVAAAADGEDVRDMQPRPCVLAIGNEGAGLSPELMRAASKKVSIPMPGGAESLNAAAAAAILMWELFKTEERSRPGL